ncbi:hypothetical protein EN850_20795 [Mesorhizobium sp. M8A.F.Ca.ET.207.01.1.1]|uniref:hypothetical protein n=1 Tax=Mesorhizobium sp. M8A.F.Ca.ET.207.01.1.1 TaxID=2563968 RepID=UPI00109D49D5|nr:hypothetical protein [Mesorhizobium sp. M8A.F.Ca.ET.207.01.1.1]TGQ79329.1 hypothetical protein EN850_20795 [Mesorhizobium sp. M8A.F.Ca.ET.207.01.1.1]
MINGRRTMADAVEVVWRHQTYRRVGSEPYTRRDGTGTMLGVWRSNCKFCGAEFECRASDMAETFRGTRHCQAHRRPADRVRAPDPAQRPFTPIEVYDNDGARK